MLLKRNVEEGTFLRITSEEFFKLLMLNNIQLEIRAIQIKEKENIPILTVSPIPSEFTHCQRIIDLYRNGLKIRSKLIMSDKEALLLLGQLGYEVTF